MTRDKLNGAAYDLSLFEPQKKVGSKKATENKKKKDNKIIRLDADRKAEDLRRKRNPARIVGVSLLTAVVAGVGSLIIYNNVMLNELSQKITDTQTEITHYENLQAEYQMRIDNKLTPELIQNYAESKLGMTQMKSAQKKFISLSDGDLGEVIHDDGTNTVLDSLSKIFSGS